MAVQTNKETLLPDSSPGGPTILTGTVLPEHGPTQFESADHQHTNKPPGSYADQTVFPPPLPRQPTLQLLEMWLWLMI